MKRPLVFYLVICSLWRISCAGADLDTLRVMSLEEVVVRGVTLADSAPFPCFNLSQTTLATFQGGGQELPFLLARLPGVIAWGENGTGFGTTHLSIRGTSENRINVTLDGVPLNSPEDQCVFWANMNSYAAFLGGLQLQKGVGSSTNGDGAFGGNIALESRKASLTPTLTATVSYGSYNTFNGGVNASSGLMHDWLALDIAYHHTFTDGYMDGTAGKSGSLYLGMTGMGTRMVVKVKNIFNYENTGQAWNGVDTGELLDGNYGVATGLGSYKDFYAAGLGRYNSLYERLIVADDGYTLQRYTLRDGTRWRQTTDNFWQDKTIVSASYSLSARLQTSLSLHYTYGYGYYDELKYNAKLSQFGLSDFALSDGTLLTRTDFVRQKGLSQHTFGAVYNLSYQSSALDIVGGVSVQGFACQHFGYLTYIGSEAIWQALGGEDYKYYDSDATKWDANAFVRATYTLPCGIALYGDVQYRYVDYETSGRNDKFVATASGYTNQLLDVDKTYHFVNPKVGISYHHNGHSAFVSLALSHHEPERNNFTNNGSYPAPRAERLTDLEVSYSYSGNTWHASATGYYMRYRNQFVQTGQLSDIGEALTTNIRDSYRMGLELAGAIRPLSWLALSGNVAFSLNRILDFDEVVDDWDNGTQTIHYSRSTLANSPACVANFSVFVERKGWTATWRTAFVSRQYLDNTSCRQRALPAYTTSDVRGSYTLSLRGCRLELALAVRNIFNRHYAASGWVYSAICDSAGNTNEQRYREIGYYPMAGRTLMSNITFTL